ncbi:MAG: RsmB/NOP family class I SAM-dependent RNA methyltransferase [Shewanella sp.]|nr:RsmB/NOP family class I SAM-dependent RNA methyltransferase [Shewanella sp.]MCF1432017.1 RsmB/NOP family class I SAM-dependent RNA methyltransferase [Shewanella sp.]MCF1438486.1 RsmB/NOP family class I SAM-dependent RNA methyltransferase [Shewanella sp.]MCF1459467.1 RsmB/NOP family class I SAM-dependent RNA methyltransferase [Shewanella sp.]
MANSPLTIPSFQAESIQVNSCTDLRALTYARTLHQLMTQVSDGHLPADKTLANYFRDHKKHGSKDRRVLRETLFGLFRWWGWLRKLPQQNNHCWPALLAVTAMLEQHPWQDLMQSWAQMADIRTDAQMHSPELLIASVFPHLGFSAKELLPDWFWQYCSCPNPEKLAASLSSRPPIWARAQGTDRDKLVQTLQQSGINAVACEWFADALSLGYKSVNFKQIPAYAEGKLEIQDLASQVIGQVCNPTPGQSWWDACAGAGGKSLQLSVLSRAKGQAVDLVASDIRPRALEELQKRAKRADLTNIQLAPWRSDALPVKAQAFDCVLVDTPCSCTGTWRRNPDMRWLDDAGTVADKPQLQLDILSRASHAVKPGGVLVYATCSLAQAENGDVVDRFLVTHPEFEAILSIHPFTGEEMTRITVWPYEADSDGMFVARMQRKKQS